MRGTRISTPSCSEAAKSAGRSASAVGTTMTITAITTTDDRLTNARPTAATLCRRPAGHFSMQSSLVACPTEPELIARADRLPVRKDNLQQLLAVNMAAGLVRQSSDDLFRLHVNHLDG